MRIAPPRRISHTYRQSLQAAPARVFPLLCPVREVEWAAGWTPRLVLSNSGLAESDCVFITPEGANEAIWYITRHEPERMLVEMLKVMPGVTACRVQVELHPDGHHCLADVTYSHTSLGPEGDRLIAGFTAEYYRRFMQQWERELNHFLATGRMLSDA